MKPIGEQKRAMRREARCACVEIDPEIAKQQDDDIQRRVLALPEYAAAGTLFIYISVGEEVSTRDIIRHALGIGKRVAVPRCIAPGVMELRAITGMDELRSAAYGLLEPGEDCPLVELDEVGFAVVPCVACDTSCNRLGKGGGYYDRTLRARAFPAAALCREAGLFAGVPMEEWDEPVDIVISEDRVIRRHNNKPFGTI